MPDVRSLRDANFKGLFSVRARLVVLALIMVVPFMADRVRTLESSRASQARALSVQLLNSARNNAEAQRDPHPGTEPVAKGGHPDEQQDGGRDDDQHHVEEREQVERGLTGH